MFGLFKRKSEKEKLQELYSKLTEESFKLSHTNRKLGDAKLAEAEQVMQKIGQLETKS
jgi:uncharacterized protein Yka (UPF0111/DUF47 family)